MLAAAMSERKAVGWAKLPGIALIDPTAPRNFAHAPALLDGCSRPRSEVRIDSKKGPPGGEESNTFARSEPFRV